MRKFSFFGVLFVVLAVATCASTGFFFSNILILSNLIPPSNSIEVEELNVYALTTTNAENENELKEAQEELQSINGAGFIFKKDDKYFLISSIYENYRDAELVEKNLKSYGMDCSIIQISLEKKSLAGNFSNEEKAVLQDCLSSARTSYKKLYDISISLDTNIYDKQKAKLECNNVFSNLVSIKTNFETLFEVKNFNEINKRLLKENEILSNLISENLCNKSQTFSSLIKFSYCKILLLNT